MLMLTGKNPAACGRGDVMQGKPGVTSIACVVDITAGKTQCGLRTQQR